MMKPKFALSHDFLSVHHEYFVGTFASNLLCPPTFKCLATLLPKNHVVFSSGRKNPIPFNSRPVNSLEFNEIQNLVDHFTHVASEIMWESFEMNCSTSCATWVPSVVPSQAGERRLWFCLHRIVVGTTTYPLPIEVLIQLNGRNTSKWKIEKVFYNKVVFDSIENFMNAYKGGNTSKIFQAAPKEESLYSSFARRGNIKPASRNVEPSQYEPGGKRYTAEKNHVEYMGWSFDFRVRTSSGPQLFDIRFNSTRIVYELSLQEAAAFYTGFSPVPSYADYLDSAWALGRTFELTKGIDCPSTASYFDVIAFVDSGKVTKRKNAVCIFELNTGVPLRRHYELFTGDGYYFYGGIPSTALVFRTIITPYNYDYVFDYIFYQNGIIEVKVMTTGYILSSYWSPEARQFSTRVQKDVSGSNHDHFFHFKVDLDIAGKENSFELIKTKVNKTTRWDPNGEYRYQKYSEHDHKKTEMAAAYTYDFETPSYLNFYNGAAKNIHGVPRGYRVQLNSFMKQMYPKNWSYTRAIQWTYNQLVVTKYKKNETRSSSIYNQMNFFDPMIDFSQFIDDNEDINNEDLVSWVTVGVMHFPHSEDIPTTTTPANSAGFYLRPYNYFDEDPSVASRDSVVITPSGKDGSNVKRSERNARSSCIPRDDPISYSGRLAS